MTRTTVDYGIDLGTTNSAISVLNGVEPEIIKDNEGQETTPSAVWIDKRNRLRIGRAAKFRCEEDQDNTCVEFKLQMGTADWMKRFVASGRELGPEDLSAEVLKSLKGDVAQRTGENIDAAVITVPAAFSLGACDATKRAAGLAGLTHAPLLQEPTAAALTYGFQTSADNVFWLVYDLGGGTFDAAVIQVRDGEFTVVNHRGDNFLGGKLIDWRIVEELLIPAAIEQTPFTGLARGDREWAGAVNKLKQAAERAKIELSRQESAVIEVELKDKHERACDFEYELRRADVERLTEPYIVRTVNHCRTALTERGLGPGDIEKVLLVGGPTLSPYVRERLADPREGLGIPLDYSQDPITVVARGAAIFAGTQRLDSGRPAAPPPAGEYAVELDYEAAGPETEPFVAGRVTGGDTDGFTIEFVNDNDDRLPWRSGKLALTPDGAFTATLLAEPGRRNTYRIELADAAGTRRPVTPDRLTYTVGTVDTQPPLTHAIGIALDNNEVEWLAERGTPLPTRRRKRLRTTVGVSRGSGKGMIRIPVVEGEHRRADRNRFVGRLEIEPEHVMRDVPEGSEVELVIRIDESRLITARAYVPMLDEEFEHVINLQTEIVPSHEKLDEEARFERLRLGEARQQAGEIRDERALAVLRRIDGERIVEDVTALVEAARVDPDAAKACGNRLLDLKAAIDEVEDAMEWPALVHEADEIIPAVRELVERKNDEGSRRAFAVAESAVREAIEAQDADLLRQRTDELRLLGIRILDETDQWPYIVFDKMRETRAEMSDPARAGRLIADGERAADTRDVRTLRKINDQLIDMLPGSPSMADIISTVRRD